MRRFVVAILLLVLPFGVWYGQNFRIRMRTTVFQHPAITKDVVLVHISDLHGMNWGDDNAPLIRLIEKQSPDVICVTGDMYTRTHPSQRRIAVSLMQQLRRIAPVLFVPGEHDRDAGYWAELTAAGVMHVGLQCISVAGIDFYGCSRAWFGDDEDLSARYTLCPERCSVLLCHIPQPQAFADAGFDLILSGDTHGGVIRLPGIGTLFNGDEWLPEMCGEVFIHGEYVVGQTRLSVTSGLGGLPIRLGAPPEISVIRMIKE